MKAPDFPRKAGPLARRVAEACRRDGSLRPGDRLVAAVSGGADSAALLLLLAEISRTALLPLEIHVAHLHHGLRGDRADEDLAFVEDLARALGVPFVFERADVRAFARQRGEGVEEAGRRARYDFYVRTAKRLRATAVATGHTLQDQAETVVHRLVRGTGVRGLAGIHPSRPLSPSGDVRVIRPLLWIPREDLLSHLASRNVRFREDETNRDPSFTRNRIRHEVLPLLRGFNPGVDAALAGLAGEAWSLRETLREGGACRVEEAGEGRVVVRGGSGDESAVSSLREAFARASGAPGRLKRVHLQALQKMLGGEGPARMTLPGGIPARREGGALWLGKPPGGAGPIEGGRLSVPGAVRAGAFEIRAALVPPPPDPRAAGAGGWLEYADADRVPGPFAVRSRRPGDRFHGLGSRGRCRLKEFFRSRGVPPEARDGVPLVVDGRGRILWVVGHRLAEWARLGPETSGALRLEASAITARAGRDAGALRGHGGRPAT